MTDQNRHATNRNFWNDWKKITNHLVILLKLQMADAMAASSGGVDWATILKPFLSTNNETSNKAELLELCSAIIKRYCNLFSLFDVTGKDNLVVLRKFPLTGKFIIF